MLDPILPFAFVTATISPVHLPISVSLIFFVTAFIHITTFPCKSSHAVFLIQAVLTFVLIAVRSISTFPPFSIPVFHSVFELTDIDGRIFPLVLTRAARLAVYVLTYIRVSICKHVSALAMLETKFPLAFVSVSIFPLVHPVTICFALRPLPDVRVAENTFPNPLTFLEPILPFAFIYLPVYPGVYALAMWLVILEFSLVSITVAVSFHASAIPVIVQPLTFVKSRCTVLHYSQARSFSI